MNILDVIMNETGNIYTRKASTHGGEFSGPCPWCGGEDRFSIHPVVNHFVCRQCKKAGDSIEFIRIFLNKSYTQACELLNVQPKIKFSSLDVSKDLPGQNEVCWQPREINFPKEVWQKKAEVFLFEKYKYLLSGHGFIQRQWLNKRGLNNETIKKARLGFNTVSANYDPTVWGMDALKKDKDPLKRLLWVPVGLIIPQFYNDKLIRLRIRQTDIKAKSRFILVKGSSMGFFDYSKFLGLHPFNQPWIVTESELDGWLIQQECQTSCRVFSIGNASARPDKQTHDFLKNNPGLINLDNDKAGHNEMAWWVENYPDAIPYYSLIGKDPGEDFANGVDIKQWIQDGLSQLNICHNKDKKEQLKIPRDFKKEIIDKYNKSRKVGIEYKEFKEIRKQVKKTILKDRPKNVDLNFSNFETKICLHNYLCVSLSGNVCLIDKSNPFKTYFCPKRKWYAWNNGAMYEIILGENFKKGGC